jgi:zinc protease
MKTGFVNLLILLLLVGLSSERSSWAIPTIQSWQTDNGVPVYFVPAPELPMVDVEVVFDAGSARDGDKPGLATLTNSLLNEGAGGHSADQIAEQFDNLGAKVSYSVDRDMATISLRSLTDTKLLQPALEMLAILITQPDFEASTFERVRQQTLAGLKYQQQSPDTIAEQAFYQAVFAEHPYATLADGTPESVAKLTREDLKAFHTRYYVASNALVAITGALERTAAEQLANTLVKQLVKGDKAPALPPVKPLAEAKTIHLEHPSTQTHLIIGQPGTARKDPDYFTLYVGNYILGDNGLVSRLVKAVREERGLAYSVYSYFLPLRETGPFVASLETRNDQAQQALQVVQSTLRDFVEFGPSTTELEEAKQGITGNFPLRIKSNSNIIGYLSVIGFYQLPLDYLQTFNQKIEAVTLENIKTVFQRRLQLDKLVTVTVGGNPKNPGENR